MEIPGVAGGRDSAQPSILNTTDRITIEPRKRSGKPCIRGLRITVEDVLPNLAAGMSEAQILPDFPDLEHEDLLSVFDFAADRERRLLVNSAAQSPLVSVRLLFDANLSSRLVGNLADIFPQSAHLRDLRLQSAPDELIWRRAAADGFIIFTQDDGAVVRRVISARLSNPKERRTTEAEIARTAPAVLRSYLQQVASPRRPAKSKRAVKRERCSHPNRD